LRFGTVDGSEGRGPLLIDPGTPPGEFPETATGGGETFLSASIVVGTAYGGGLWDGLGSGVLGGVDRGIGDLSEVEEVPRSRRKGTSGLAGLPGISGLVSLLVMASLELLAEILGRFGTAGFSGRAGRGGGAFRSVELSTVDVDSESDGSLVEDDKSMPEVASEVGDEGAALGEEEFAESSPISSAEFTIFENFSGSTCNSRKTNAIESIQRP
jgi:hypothetical protein